MMHSSILKPPRSLKEARHVSRKSEPAEAEDEQAQLGRELRAHRQERGLSLKQVAEATGISVSFLSLVESGGSDITFRRLRRLLRLYGKTPSDVLAGAPDSRGTVV